MRYRGIIVATLLLSGCGYNHIQTLDEQVNAFASQIQVQLQRRADLVPNLVSTVQGVASHETEVFTAIADARARMSGAMERGNFGEMAAASDGMTSALGRLIAVAEAYPQLQSSQNFRDLQVQLEGTENRLSTARGDYNTAVRDYNAYIRRFPQVLTAKVIGAHARDYFEAAPSASEAPRVSFN